MINALDLLVAERLMRIRTNRVRRRRIRAHFRAAFRDGPVFRRPNQSAADALAAQVSIDVPAFDVADVWSCAALGFATNRKLDHSAKAAVRPLSDKDRFSLRRGEHPRAILLEVGL